MSDHSATLPSIERLLRQALAGQRRIAPLKGFTAMPAETDKTYRVFFRVGCRCGAAGLLSVEVAKDKTVDEVCAALPALLQRLNAQADHFESLSCEDHTRMAGVRRPPPSG